MKTVKSIQTRNNQTNNNSLTLKNQEVMKTKKYSISMKAFVAVVFAFAFSTFLNAQFVAPSPASNANLTAEEVRATSTITYDLSANHTAGDTYRWVVRGGTIDDAGGTLTITTDGDSSIVEWTANLQLITVDWDTDITATPIGSAPGEVIVQKTVGGTCASELQTLGITMWNPATANLDLTGLVTEICSGELVGGNLPVDLTGAPDPVADGFDVTYTVVATGGLTDLGGVPLNGTGTTIQDNDELAQIALPAGIINPTGVDQTLTITLTAMQDDFDTAGSVGAIDTYVITVHPTPATGEIISSSSLSRR
jgi:hypothetical protein